MYFLIGLKSKFKTFYQVKKIYFKQHAINTTFEENPIRLCDAPNKYL